MSAAIGDGGPLRAASFALFAFVLASACQNDPPRPQGVTAADEPGDAAAASAGATRKTTEASVLDKEGLSSKVRASDPSLAKEIGSPDSTVELLPTPFFDGAHVYRVTRRLPERDVVFTIGVAGDYVASLAARPEAFLELAHRGRVKLASADDRKAYVTTYFETTRSFGERFQSLRSIDDLPPRPNLDKAEQARLVALKKKYASVVKGLALSAAPPWRGSVFAIKGQALVRYDVELTGAGDLRARPTELEADLPIPWAR